LISSVVRIAVKFLFQMGCAAKGMLWSKTAAPRDGQMAAIA
jgi:hypothetical protein